MILLLIGSTVLFAQNDESKNKGLRIFNNDSNSPLYIISAEDKILKYPEVSNTEDTATIKQSMDSINPEWIQSIEVFKGKEATERYGTSAQNGAIIIKTKEGAFYKMSEELRSKFKGE